MIAPVWPPEPHTGMVVLAARHRGEWGVWAAPESVLNGLARPGVTAPPKGSLDQWAQAFPLTPEEKLDKVDLPEGMSGLAPGPEGMLVLDYDDHRALALTRFSDAGSVGLTEWGLRSRQSTSPYRDWARALIESGTIPQGVTPQGDCLTVPAHVPLDVLWAFRWLEDELRVQNGLAKADNDRLETLVDFPLVHPGWDIQAFAWQNDPEVLEAYRRLEDYGLLSAQELEIWKAWASSEGIDSLQALFKGKSLQESWVVPEPTLKTSRPRF